MQIQHLGEPIEVRITEWNTGGLLTRIEVGIGFPMLYAKQGAYLISNCISFAGFTSLPPESRVG